MGPVVRVRDHAATEDVHMLSPKCLPLEQEEINS